MLVAYETAQQNIWSGGGRDNGRRDGGRDGGTDAGSRPDMTMTMKDVIMDPKWTV